MIAGRAFASVLSPPHSVDARARLTVVRALWIEVSPSSIARRSRPANRWRCVLDHVNARVSSPPPPNHRWMRPAIGGSARPRDRRPRPPPAGRCPRPSSRCSCVNVNIKARVCSSSRERISGRLRRALPEGKMSRRPVSLSADDIDARVPRRMSKSKRTSSVARAPT